MELKKSIISVFTKFFKEHFMVDVVVEAASIVNPVFMVSTYNGNKKNHQASVKWNPLDKSSIINRIRQNLNITLNLKEVSDEDIVRYVQVLEMSKI